MIEILVLILPIPFNDPNKKTTKKEFFSNESIFEMHITNRQSNETVKETMKKTICYDVVAI